MPGHRSLAIALRTLARIASVLAFAVISLAATGGGDFPRLL